MSNDEKAVLLTDFLNSLRHYIEESGNDLRHDTRDSELFAYMYICKRQDEEIYRLKIREMEHLKEIEHLRKQGVNNEL